MKKNNILLLVNNLDIVKDLKEESNITFLFPVSEFSVGFERTFRIEEIPEGFIFVNRILDNEGIEKFKKFIGALPSNIKGIVFDDVGVLNVLLKVNLNITKILFLNHLNCNYESVNAYLDFVDSVVVSTDITIEEIDEILKKAKKPVVLYTFGHINIMYSRRTLLTNYNNHFKKDVPTIADLTEKISGKKFKAQESIYGTVIYTNEPFNGLELRNRENVLFNLINMTFFTNEKMLEIIKSDSNLEDKYPYKYLSAEKTIVKISDIKD